MDEATSALDEETEKKLLKNILEKAPEKTCIVTTHRPGVLRLCRRVYRVEDGKIAEQKQDFSGQSDCGQYGIEISLDDQIFEDPYQKKFRLSMA